MTVFFDMDDTLYDRGQPFAAAAQTLFGGDEAWVRRAYRACTDRGNEVFLPSQRGEITMEEMYIYRWGKGFGDVGLPLTDAQALAFQDLYRQKQGEITLSPVVEELLEQCAKRTEGLGLISNGPSKKQWEKVACLGLERFMKREMILISGDLGVDKPDTAIFHLARQRCGRGPEALCYVGDSLTNDIYPAAACGWQSVWVNWEGRPIPGDVHPRAVVRDQGELAEALLRLL